MTEMELHDNIGLLSEKMTDIQYLEQEIHDFFETYDGDKQDDEYQIAYEFNRYASLCRILDCCIFEAVKLSKEIYQAVKDND